MSIPAWIITLNSTAPNVVSLKSSLEEQGFEVAFFDAVDGRKSTPTLEADESISQFKSLINRKAPLTNSEIGCYLSHYRLIKQAYQQGKEHVLIFEDDVIIEPGLFNLVNEITKLGENAHMVKLMALKIRKRKVLKTLSGDYQLVRPVRGSLGAQGYVLNREGMKRILDYGATLYMPIDKVYDSFFMFDLNSYNIEPHAIYETVHESSIKKTKGIIDNRAWVKASWRLNKLHRSILRKLDQLKHRDEYQGATKPSAPPGKSSRLRD